MVNNIRSALKRNLLTVMLLAAALGLAHVLSQPLSLFPSMVDWDTIITLTGLILITTGIRESGFFYLFAYRISRRINNERLLAMFLVFLAAILSMFLTNDIALFIVVPLTLTLQQIVEDDYSKIIIFEAIAVNAGSSLTPIGNPQNIFLWHQWGVSFPVFVKAMAPLVSIMSVGLFVMILICFPPKQIRIVNNHHLVVDRALFLLSSVLLIMFAVSVELQFEKYFLIITFFSILLTRRSVILKSDWGFVFLFITIFIDLHLICQLQAVNRLFAMLDFSKTRTLFLSGALFSQAFSNVPAAIILFNYSTNFKIIAYAVNVGANGCMFGSFANLIALRLSKKTPTCLSFHLYSLPYFMVTFALSYCLLI